MPTTNRKRKTRPEVDNERIAELLNETGKNERLQGNVFKARAFERASQIVKDHPKQIKSGDEARELKGIGDDISGMIDEILENDELGRLKRFQRDPKLQSLRELEKIPGVGPGRARRWYNQGIKSIDDLKKQVDKGEMKLTNQQRIGLRYLDELRIQVPREDVKPTVSKIKELAKGVDSGINIKACGTYRRGKPFIGNIEMLMVHEKNKKGLLKQVVNALHEHGVVVEDISQGAKKYSGIYKLQTKPSKQMRLVSKEVEAEQKKEKEKEGGEEKEEEEGSLEECKEEYWPKHGRLDIRYANWENFATELLTYTGSADLNQKLRMRAQDMNLILSEYGLYKARPRAGRVTSADLRRKPSKGEQLPTKTERDVFKHLGLDYLPPKERDTVHIDTAKPSS